jgi:hypothetical protein
MKSSLDVLDSYADAFRNLVNAKVWANNNTIRQLLCLNDDRDWHFLCTSMDVVNDASAAIRNFLRFGLDGPTRYQDVGERYLRLYGLLSATYIQQQAALKLYKLMNVPDPKDIQAKLNGLQIRDLRHKLASHSTDFLTGEGQAMATYVPIQIGVGGFHCLYTNNEETEHQSVDLENASEEHCRAIIAVLDRTYEKAMRTLFKGQQKKQAEFNQKLLDLRTERDGGLVLRMGQDKNLTIRTMTQENPTTPSPRTRRKGRTG